MEPVSQRCRCGYANATGWPRCISCLRPLSRPEARAPRRTTSRPARALPAPPRTNALSDEELRAALASW
jgi:hypothetical protein